MSEIENHEFGEPAGVMLTIKQISRRLQVKEDTIYRHWRELGGFKVGGSIRFDWERTRQHLLEKAAREAKAMASSVPAPPGRRIPDPERRKGRRNRGETVLERIPDRYNLWGDLPETGGPGGIKKFKARERR